MTIEERGVLSELFRETFEGMAEGASGTFFLEGRESLITSCREITALQASTRVNHQRATLGAHVFHATYYLSLFNAMIRGEEVQGDWEGSWKRQAFSDEEWEDVAADLEAEYRSAKRFFDRQEEVSDKWLFADMVANIAHAAFHVGAIRALMPIVINS